MFAPPQKSASSKREAAAKPARAPAGPESGAEVPAINAAWSRLVTSPAATAAGLDGVVQRTPDCAHPGTCPSDFCNEFQSQDEARSHRKANRDNYVSDISGLVSDGGTSEVAKLYNRFLDGGDGHKDLSNDLATYFTKSAVTGSSTRYLEKELEAYFKAKGLQPGKSETVQIADAIPKAITALGTPNDPNVMAFRLYNETPGLLAGGVGTGQAACKVGAKPSEVEDSRTATGSAIGTNSGGTISVTSFIEFSATDTLDFCPGNCGGEDAQKYTVPLSRYEASGISGDVPFTVKFPAPVGAFDSE